MTTVFEGSYEADQLRESLTVAQARIAELEANLRVCKESYDKVITRHNEVIGLLVAYENQEPFAYVKHDDYDDSWMLVTKHSHGVPLYTNKIGENHD